MEIAKVIDVKKTYETEKVRFPAIRGVSLEVKKGEFVAIAGPSGSGKTTLLNIIGCLDNPTEGKVIIDGEDITSLFPKRLTEIRRRKIGFIFQTFNLLPALTVYENIELPLVVSDLSSKMQRRKVEEMIETLGLSKVANHRAVNISGGQQQRVAIGRALVKEPIIVLADEPTGNLDSETGKTIIELMKRLNKEKDVSFIFSTHDPLIMNYADTIYRLKDGMIE